MGGKSTSETTQQSTTAPWAPTQGLLGNIIGQLGSASSNTGLTGDQNNALSAVTANTGANSGIFAPLQTSFARSLYNGGGALDQAGNVNANLGQYTAQTLPLASNTNYNPYTTPGFGDAVNTLTNDITNNINGQFAAAGRDLSPGNSTAVSRGIAQGVAPTIAAQFNQNVENQQGAANALYNAGNSNAGILAGLQQQFLANQGQGAGAAGGALSLNNQAPEAAFSADATRFSQPLQNLGILAQLGIPIAGLGSQSTGQSNTTQQMSGAQQFATILGGIGSLVPKGPISFGK